MDEPLNEPRNPAAPGKGARHRNAHAGRRDVFPLVKPAALRMWLFSMLLLAVAAFGAWSMRVKTDPPVIRAIIRIELPQPNNTGGDTPSG